MDLKTEKEKTGEEMPTEKAVCPRAVSSRTGFFLVLACNLFFCLGVYILFSCRCLNDDVALAQFVNGAFSQMDFHTPYNHPLYASLVRGLYRVFGTGISWYILCQYLILVLSYAAVAFLILETYGLRKGILLDLLLLLGFGFYSYFRVTYTMTAGVASCAGTFLLVRALEREPGRERSWALIGSMFLVSAGFMLRWKMAIPCYLLSAVTGVPLLRSLFHGNNRREKLGSLIPPLVLLLVLLGGLYVSDRVIWSEAEYQSWENWNASRTEVMDYLDIAPYDKKESEYAEAGIRRTELSFFSIYAFSDPEVFTEDFFRTVKRLNQNDADNLSWKNTLSIFINRLISGIVNEPYYAALAGLFLAWIIKKKHAADLEMTSLWLLFFALLEIYLAHKGRYGADRVELGLALSGFIVMTSLPEKRTGLLRARIAALLFILEIGMCGYLCHPRSQLRMNNHLDFTAIVQEMEHDCHVLCAEEENVYLDTQFLLYEAQYLPLRGTEAGLYDRIIPLCGWPAQHPIQRNALQAHGISNPFRDSVGREDVLWICEKIETVIAYIQDHYAPAAYAEKVEPLSTVTGLEIYRIKVGNMA